MEIHSWTSPPLGRILWARLNRSVKSALRKTLWKSTLTYEEVETIVISMEGVLNSRPLCYVDDSDLSEPLTPSHLMYGRNISHRPVVSPSARVKHIKKLQETFWKRFSSEYLTALRERDIKKQKGVTDSSEKLKVGDVVMIRQKHIVRSSWPLGKVTRLIQSDGATRGAELLTESGTLKRSVDQLHPLEMS